MAAAVVLLALVWAGACAEQEGPWRSIQILESDDLTLRLRYRRHASPLLEEWIGFEFENRTNEPLLIRQFEYSMDHELVGRHGGGLLNGWASTLLAPSPLAERDARLILKPGIWRALGRISAEASSRLALARPGGDRLRITCSASVLTASTDDAMKGSTEIEVRWDRPDPEGLARLRGRLEALLDAPDGSAAPVHCIPAWLGKPEIAGHLEPARLLAALERRDTGSSSAARTGIARHLAERFGDSPIVEARFVERLRAGDLEALNDLARSRAAWPFSVESIWSPTFVEPVIRMIEATPRAWHVGLYLLAQHRVPDVVDLASTTRLAEALLSREVLTLTDSERDHAGLPDLPNCMRLLAMTGHPGIVEQLTPFLTDRRVRNEHRGYPEGWSMPVPYTWAERPPPRRACDSALDAILTLRGRDLVQAYRAAGWSRRAHGAVPAADGARERWVDQVRDRMIADLRRDLER